MMSTGKNGVSNGVMEPPSREHGPHTTEQLDVNALLRLDEGLVHSDVYTSPAVFELEIEKLFHRGWVYIGHESEIPRPGDFVVRWMGRQSVILNRDADGKLHLFMNRCRHRAAALCHQAASGNAEFFRCPYHGWTYKNDGALVGVPFPQSYSEDFKREDLPLLSVELQTYRGFVWGNLAPDGRSLADHLGICGRHAIDMFCDASPSGEVILQQGVLKNRAYANWKFQGGDGYHPPVTHEANFYFMRKKRLTGDARNMMGQNTFQEGYKSRDLGNGHVCLDYRIPGSKRTYPNPAPPWLTKYRDDLIEAYGPERGAFLFKTAGNPHTVFMPNLHLVNVADVRLIRPIAADLFEIYFFCAFLKDAPDELNELRLADVTARMSPAGFINPDDVEMFERNQLGMRQMLDPWKVMTRGLHHEVIDDDLESPEEYRWSGTRAAHYSDELPQRAQLQHWAEQLSR